MLRAVSILVTSLAGGPAHGRRRERQGHAAQLRRDQYRPGDRAVGRLLVTEASREEGPFNIYLVRGSQPLWFGHLPENAVPVGKLRISRAVAPDKYLVRAVFRVPRVADARYAVWVCAAGPGRAERGCWRGFGDLVYGGIVVKTEESKESTSAGLSSNHGERDEQSAVRVPTNRAPTYPWSAVILSALVLVGLTTLLLGIWMRTGRRRRAIVQ
jgi:hypothetical protein